MVETRCSTLRFKLSCSTQSLRWRSIERASSMFCRFVMAFTSFYSLFRYFANRGSASAMGWARVGEEQQLDGNGSLRPLLGVADAFDVLAGQRGQALVDLAELFGRDVEQELTGAGCLLPLGGDLAAQLEALLQALEVEVVEDTAEGIRRQAGLRIVADVGIAHARVHEAPRALATGDAGDLLDEPVLRELAKVERARRRALSDEFAGFRSRQRTLRPENLEQRDPDRVGHRPHRPRVGELARFVAGDMGRRALVLGIGDITFDIHVSKYIYREISLQAVVGAL